MSPPWEKYQETPPWEKYRAPQVGDVRRVEREAPPERSLGEKAARTVGLFAQGANDPVYSTAFAPLDISGWLAKKAGLVSPEAEAPSRQITNFLASIPGRIGLTTRDAPVRLEPETTWEKGVQGAGEGVGNALAVIVPAGAVANTARAGTVTQGVANALRTQPVMQTVAGGVGGAVTGATDNPWLGLGASMAVPVVGSIGRGLVTPVTPRLTPQEQNLVQAAQREGITLTPAQQTGSPSLRGIEETMARMPLTNTPMQNALRDQREQFARAVTSRTGTTAADAAPNTLANIRQGLEQIGDDLVNRTTANIDPQFVNDVRNVAQNYGRRLETDVAPVFRSYMDDLEPLLQAAMTPNANPQIAGDVYRNIRSGMTTRMRETPNNSLRRALGGLVEALDDVMERSAGGVLANEWRDWRRQWQAYATIDKAMSGGTQVSRSAGDIPFNALTTAVRSADTEGYARGRGQLNELARIGDYLASRVPNSGTPERLAWQNLLTGGGLFTAGAASGIGIPAAAAGAIAPYAIGRFYNSPAGRAYLTNQLAGPTDWRALYGGILARQALDETTGGPNALRPGGGR